VEVAEGTATFTALTNIPAVTVHGKTKAVTGAATVIRDSGRLVIERAEARIPVTSLGTGMSLRDTHMRKLVFTTPAGETPDLVFESEKTECHAASNAETTCELKGNLTLRGVKRDFHLTLKVRSDGAEKYRVSGEGSVKLSTYGIEPPSQLGVRVADEVRVALELRAISRTDVAEASGTR
jgi:polyisoprenoid-binding protein YceI